MAESKLSAGGPLGSSGPRPLDRKPFILADNSLESGKQSDCVSVINSHLSDCLHAIKYPTNMWALYPH